MATWCRWPIFRSSTKVPPPVSRRGSSTRRTLRPIHLPSVFASAFAITDPRDPTFCSVLVPQSSVLCDPQQPGGVAAQDLFLGVAREGQVPDDIDVLLQVGDP